MRSTTMIWAFLSLVLVASGLEARIATGPQDEGDLWVVLVAGSNTWFNYRHQADVCHAYQIAHAHGVPDDHIIVMMYDDIAHNGQNPTPGKIINRPGGPDVYEGVPKDYTGKEVTPEVFFKVLSGDSEGLEGRGSGKVVKSGPNDRIFVNLVDHGAPGIFAFPEEFMKARKFASVVLEMKKQRKFKEMYVYMEACESGSMFQNHFPDDIGFYALSASSPSESSYACYYDAKLGTYLGDVFSVKWMEDADKEDLNQETLEKEYEIVKKETNTSHVMQWGETSLDSNKVSFILGAHGGKLNPPPPVQDPCGVSCVASPDVPTAILQGHLDSSSFPEDKALWRKLLIRHEEHRDLMRGVMRKLVIEVTADEELTNQMLVDNHLPITRWDCYEQTTEAFHELCFNLGQNPYALTLVQTLGNLCQHGFEATDIVNAALRVCTHPHVTGIH